MRVYIYTYNTRIGTFLCVDRAKYCLRRPFAVHETAISFSAGLRKLKLMKSTTSRCSHKQVGGFNFGCGSIVKNKKKKKKSLFRVYNIIIIRFFFLPLFFLEIPNGTQCSIVH